MSLLTNTSKCSLLLCLVLVFASLKSLSNVTITPASGGSGISADKSAGSSSDSFTTIGDITISSGVTTDFGLNQSNVTFILSAPANWQFKAGTGAVAISGPTITSASISVTGSAITVTYSTGSTSSASNSIVLSGIQVRASVKTTLSAANIVRNGGTAVIGGWASNSTTNCGTLAQVAGNFVKLQLILPGETAVAGTTTGKTGTPTAWNAGTQVTTLVVNAVDENWNKVTTATDVVGLTTTDPNAALPVNAALSSGSRTFSLTLKTPGTQTITASNITNTAVTSSVSPSFTVNVGPFKALQVLLPGETAAPGSSTGKTGTPTARTAGTAFSVTVNAVDAAFNVVTSATDVVRITSTDVNAVLPADAALVSGTKTFSLTLKTAALRTVTATDITDGTKTASTSPSITTNPGTFSKLQIILPGETAVAGTATGKTGTPTNRSAGTAFSVVVNAVDDYWNKVTTITDNILLSSSDANAVIPAAAALASGTKTNFSVTLRKVGSATITATDQTNSNISAAVSASAPVVVGVFAKLQLLLPGETAAPGTSAGKTGTPTGITAGTPVSVIVNGVDLAYNVVNTVTDVVKIASSDVNASLPANASLASGTANFSITLKTAGSRTITASDVTTTSKSSSTSPSVTVSAGAVAKLQILLPGETSSPGTASGKTGTPTARSAGTAFAITVNAVDPYFNKVSSVSDVVAITSTDVNATYSPASSALTSGTKTNFNVTFKTLGTQTITATDATNSNITASTSASVTVNVGPFAKLQLLMPGETAAPGTSTGKTGTPSAQTAGTAFSVTVNAVDAAFNLVNSATDVVKISSSDINAVLPANAALASGTKTFSVTLRTAGSRTVTATDVTNGTKTNSPSPAFTVNTGAFSDLQVLVQGESASAGSATGKIGNQNPPARGTSFTITVNAVDNCFNKITTATNSVSLTSSDALAVIPAAAALVSGTRAFTVNLKTAGTQTVTATGGSFSKTVSVLDNVSSSNASDYFRSITSGNWSDAASWQSSVDGVNNWHAATLTPTTSANAVTILDGIAITVTGNVSVDQVTVQSGGQLIVNSGVTLTVADGTGTDLDVAGVLNNAGAITTTGTLVIEETGRYQHAASSSPGTIPTATWTTGSTCEIIGYTSATGALTNGNQSFYNLIWNCPSQNVSGSGVSMGGTFSAVNLTVTSSGSGNMILGTAGGTVSISGDYVQTNGNLVLNSTSGTLNMNLAGSFIQSGGTFQKGTGVGNVNFSGGSVVQNFIKSGGSLSGAIVFTVNPGAYIDFGTNILDASTATFTLSSGATLYTANTAGITASGSSGSVQTATRTFSTGANYVYNGNDIQDAGTGLPLTVNNLTINNALGVVLPATSNTYTVSGALALTSGSLDMRTNSLAAGASFLNSGTGALYTQSTSATPLPSAKSWTSDIYYNGAGTQTIVPGNYTNVFLSEIGMKVGAGGTVAVSGNWTSADGDVDFSQNNTNVVFNGTNQTINDASVNGITFKNLTFNNSGTKTLVSGSYSITNGGVLSVSGSAILAANGNLTLNCDAVGHASVAPLTGSADITGNVNVKVFLTGNSSINYRGTRGFSSPINDAALSRKTFQQLQDYIFITGPGNVSNGFDAGGTTAPNAVTIQSYNETGYSGSSNFTPLTDIYKSATVGKGYLVFFRGDRTDQSEKLNSTALPEDVTAIFSGPLNKGTISQTLTNSHLTTPTYAVTDPYNGYNLVGNPYASAIDWTVVRAASSNLDDMIQMVKAGGGTASYKNGISNGDANQYIQPGQAFYVKVKDTENTGTINFTESAKVNGISPPRFLSAPIKGKDNVLSVAGTKEGTVSAESSSVLKLRLADGATEDETTVVLRSDASETSADDAAYLYGGSVSLGSLSADGVNEAINFMPLPEQTTSVKLSVNATESKDAVLKFKSVPAGYNFSLKDNYLDTVVAVTETDSYSFAIDKSIAASYGTSRFEVVIAKPVVLPLAISNFNVKKEQGRAVLEWQNTSERNVTNYEVERSADGKVFDRVGALQPSAGTYSFTDNSPIAGINYYRIKANSSEGESVYSALRSLNFSLNAFESGLTVYPNPAADQITVGFPVLSSSATLRIFSSGGEVLFETMVPAGAEHIENNISSLPSGVYIVEVKENNVGTKARKAKLIKR